jgi:radical SAM superfamily enzyme YgiQ (UPF0313 family)
MRIALVNTNRMTPPIAPLALDYLAGAARQAGLETDLVDLCLVDDPDAAMRAYFAGRSPDLVGLTFRNVDDCFWPSGASFVPELTAIIATLRTQTGAPIVLGGVGFSIFSRQLVERSGADFGIHGDGESALVELAAELACGRRLDRVPGLIWRDGPSLRANPPAWPDSWPAATSRDSVDNATYFRLGGQIGLETKRGCNRSCVYCADPLAKGPRARLRDPVSVADEAEGLAVRGIDVLHLCDAEFNLPRRHALAVCEELIRRRLGERIRWYAYLAVVPFDDQLARQMARAGCAGINFTGDAAAPAMLAAYRQPHRREDLAGAARLCRTNRIAVMFDLLLGGPGETPDTLADTIDFVRQIEPDCAGAGLGIRLYPGTAVATTVAAEGPVETNPSIRRHYRGPIDLLRPTFYISRHLGPRPARLVREMIAGDARFFEPAEGPEPDQSASRAGPDASGDHNYNDNRELVEAIAAGARGAYWDILRRLRGT